MSISTRFYNFTNIENYLDKMYKTHHLISLSDEGIFQASNNQQETKRLKQIRQLLDNKLFFNFVNAFSDKINQPLTLNSLPSDLFNFEYYYAINLPGFAEPGWCVKITENYEQELDESETTKLRSYTENGYMINLVNKIRNIENYKRHINTHFTLEIPGNQYFKPQMHETITTKNLTEINNFLESNQTDITKLQLIIVNEIKNDTDIVIPRQYKPNPETNLIEPDNSFALSRHLEEINANETDFLKELDHITQTTQDKFKKFGIEQHLKSYWVNKAIEEALQALKQSLTESMQADHDLFENYDQYKQQVNTDFANYFKKAYITNQQKINNTLATLL